MADRASAQPADWLRPEAAAERFQVSRRTLERWARRRWIGRSRVGHVAHCSVADIEALLAAHTTPRPLAGAVEADPMGLSRSRAGVGGRETVTAIRTLTEIKGLAAFWDSEHRSHRTRCDDCGRGDRCPVAECIAGIADDIAGIADDYGRLVMVLEGYRA